MLKNETIILRPLEPDDLDLLYKWENDTRIWGVSNILLPFSKNILRRFIYIQSEDIYSTKQTRFLIECIDSSEVVGIIDIFDFDPYNFRAGVGILIYDQSLRRKGYAENALNILIDYGFNILRLRQLYASIASDNLASRNLFEKCGFEITGVKKDWLVTDDGWQDEIFMQKINKDR